MPLAFKFLHQRKGKKEALNRKAAAAAAAAEFKSLSDPALNSSGAAEPAVGHSVQSLLSKSDCLPDVTNTASEAECDILLEPEAVEATVQLEEEEAGDPLENPLMVASFFDDNGNPMDDDEEEAGGQELDEDEQVLRDLEAEVIRHPDPADDEPKYFINAAALSDEDFTPDMAASPLARSVEKKPVPAASPKPSGIPRARVPISKSYPDIIQTTIRPEPVGAEFVRAKADIDVTDGPSAGMLESLVADSLEEIRPKVFERLDLESLMAESGIGISGEKPPESWIVDFNSFSLETEAELLQESSSGSGSGSRIPVASNRSSNSNSLAFFINMEEAEVPKAAESADQKKIFSMFVDIGPKVEEKEKPKEAPNPPVINKPVKSLAAEEMMMVRGRPVTGKKTPSPHFSHRSTGERRAPQAQRFRKESGGEMSSSSVGSDKESTLMGNISNRSSLHVANYGDGSFTASSLLSSMETSAPEELDVCQGGPCFKLGMDLLRMFQEGINTDVNISVRGRYVKAHKCILASRSQYFAAILSGNWIQKAGNTIYLDEFSYNVVQFTMYHIYSGTQEIPDSIDLIELASLTDLLGLEGLREVISMTIRTKFAHNFHRPCTGCISGVLEFFPLAINYGMDELHRKMTKWICKHFVRIWPTKAFANLGDDLIDKCLRYSVNHLSPENLLDITLGCDQLLSTMPSVRWTEAIFSVVNQLSTACVQFVGENISQVLQSQRFLLFGKGQTWNISRIENTFLEGILLLKPDEACLSHVALSRLIELGTHAIDEVEWSTTFVDFLKMLRGEVEKYLLANASRAVLSKNWESLGQDVRKRICTTGFLGLDKSGNKIQKGAHHSQPHSAAMAATKNSRPASSSSTRSSRAAPRQASTAKKEPQPQASIEKSPSADINSLSSSSTTYSNSELKSAKVASVRPMPAQTPQTQTPNVVSSRNPPPPNPNTKGKATRNSATTPSSNTKTLPSQASALRKKSMEKEKSFESSSSRVNSAGSQGRGASTRTAPITPITPSRPNPFPARSFQPSPALQRAPPPPPPSKPVFLTNSEKAKAVSKPTLTLRSSRSNSISSEVPPNLAVVNTHSRQSSLGSVHNTPRTPNLSQGSRYTSTTVASKTRTNSEKTIKPPLSPLPKARFTTGGGGYASRAIGSTGMSNVRTTGHGIPSRSAESRPNRGNRAQAPAPDNTRGKRNGPNFSPDTLMTKSTYEMDSTSSQEEPKVRTLAEIGRSSTFSKDEPTILGKLDLSMEMGIEQL